MHHVSLSATVFRNTSNGMFRSFNEPTVFYSYSYPNWPETEGATIRDVNLNDFPVFQNNGWHKAEGIEFSLRTRRINSINTAFRVDAAYQRSRRGTESGIIYGSQRYNSALGSFVKPIYSTQENYTRDILLNYRAEIQSKALGMWLTIHIQQSLMNVDGRSGLTDTLALGYFTAEEGVVMIPEQNRADALYAQLRRSYEDFELLDEQRPNRFLLNLNVSKTITRRSQVTFFVNNVFNHRPRYKLRRRGPNTVSYERMNPPIFYGIEYSVGM